MTTMGVMRFRDYVEAENAWAAMSVAHRRLCDRADAGLVPDGHVRASAGRVRAFRWQLDLWVGTANDRVEVTL